MTTPKDFQPPGPRRPEGPLRRHRAPLQPGRSRAAARLGADRATRWPSAARNRLWELLQTRCPTSIRSAPSPATRRCSMARAGLKAIYLSGWQVAADANTAGAMYPDQSLYPANAGPELVPPHQPHLPARRPDRARRRRRQDRLVRADRGRRRSRLRRPAQRVRDHEGLSSRRARPAFTSRTSSRRRRSAATWAARC